ncbi:MAG: 4Fe-4S dicluster domain-containing protein [Rhizobiaceae bacterium]
MATDSPYRPFTPRAEQMALKPEISGNAINGLGETQARPARMVYWAPDPDTIPHGRMQRWFYQADPDNEHVNAARAWRAKLLEGDVPQKQGDPLERTPGEWFDALDAFCQTLPCEKCGVAQMNPDWCYEDATTQRKRIIVLGFHHDYEEIRHAPEGRAGAEVIRQYGRAAYSAKQVAGWLRLQGWDAEPLTGPMTGPVLMIPAAIAAGFGELGKHGSLINPQFGSSFRLSAVLTDAPIETTPQQDHGIDDFCSHCRVCENACPPHAISHEKQMVRGVERWYVDFDKCLPFFNQTNGCAICIAICPWSRPGTGLNLAEKLERRRNRLNDS